MADDAKVKSTFGRILRKKKIEDLGADEEDQHLHQVKKKSRSERHTTQTVGELLPNLSPPRKYWSLDDDLALMDMVGSCSYEDIASIARFTGKFSLKEIKDRWLQLLYDSKASSALFQGGDFVSSKHFWTSKEDQIISNEVSNPPLTKVTDLSYTGQGSSVNGAELLQKHRVVFHPSRTPKEIEERHQQLFKSDQVSSTLPVTSKSSASNNVTPVPNLNSKQPHEDEEVQYDPLYLDAELAAAPPVWPAGDPPNWPTGIGTNGKEEKGAIRARMKAYTKAEKTAHRLIFKGEKEYEKERERERDSKLLATIRGHKLRYMMRTKEIVLGRVASQADVNLAEEGPATKCSRRHVIIKVKRDGEFYLKNIGKRGVIVNGKLLQTDKYVALKDNSLIEICGLRFIFEINKTLYNKIKRQLP